MKRFLTALVLVLVVVAIMGQGTNQPVDDPGKAIFDATCATCHSVDPPAEKAPPMRMVVKHYLEADLEDPWAQIRAWVASPDVAKSVLPSHAVEMFGLMPPQMLETADMDALVGYLKTLEAQAPGECEMMESGGMGMMHQRGQADSTGMGMMHRKAKPDSTGRGMMHKGGAQGSGMTCNH